METCRWCGTKFNHVRTLLDGTKLCEHCYAQCPDDIKVCDLYTITLQVRFSSKLRLDDIVTVFKETEYAGLHFLTHSFSNNILTLVYQGDYYSFFKTIKEFKKYLKRIKRLLPPIMIGFIEIKKKNW